MVPPRLKNVRHRLGRRREIAGRCLDTLAALVCAGGQMIRSADGARPAVALTFGDGPSSLNTPVLLDLLAELGARATFFVVAERIKGREAVVERIVGQGHELANHTYSHPHTVYLSKPELRSEIERANATIAALAPPARYIRPPFGKDRGRIASIAAELGQQVVLWSIDSGDAKRQLYGADRLDDHAAEQSRGRSSSSTTAASSAGRSTPARRSCQSSARPA